MRFEEIIEPMFSPLFDYLESLGYTVEYKQGRTFEGDLTDRVDAEIVNAKINRRVSVMVHWDPYYLNVYIFQGKTKFDFSNYLAKRNISELDDLNRDCRDNPGKYTLESFYNSAVQLFLRYLREDLDKLIRGEEWIDAPFRHEKEMWDLIYGQQKEELFPTGTNESTTNGEDSTYGDGKEKPEKE